MPNPAKHRPYNPDPNAGLILSGDTQPKPDPHPPGYRRKKATAKLRRVKKKAERENRG